MCLLMFRILDFPSYSCIWKSNFFMLLKKMKKIFPLTIYFVFIYLFFNFSRMFNFFFFSQLILAFSSVNKHPVSRLVNLFSTTFHLLSEQHTFIHPSIHARCCVHPFKLHAHTYSLEKVGKEGWEEGGRKLVSVATWFSERDLLSIYRCSVVFCRSRGLC